MYMNHKFLSFMHTAANGAMYILVLKWSQNVDGNTC